MNRFALNAEVMGVAFRGPFWYEQENQQPGFWSGAGNARGRIGAHGPSVMTKETATIENDSHESVEGLPSIPPDFVEQEFSEQIDDPVPSHGYKMTPMVGLGGSAGSI